VLDFYSLKLLLHASSIKNRISRISKEEPMVTIVKRAESEEQIKESSVCSALLDLFLPHLCALCKEARVEEVFCADCATAFNAERLTGPCCRVCSEPFISQEAKSHTCGVCIKSPPPFIHSNSLYLYRGIVLETLHKLKYRGDVTIAKPLGKVLKKSIELMEVRPDIIVPVPLYKNRLKKRSFNQSLLIAKEATTGLSIPVDYNGLKRVRDTGAQVGLKKKERAANIKGAFKVIQPDTYRGKTVLLIDDVYTTGATMQECAGILKRAGASTYAITVARAAKF
jgi:ComF family protein